VTRLVGCEPGDARFVSALKEAGLPACTHDARCFALAEGEGFGAIEGDGPDRLLRSIVVPLAWQGRGVGTWLVAALSDEARNSDAERLWLLTIGAADFFAGRGWVVADRAAAPEAIRTSDQFTTLCPASATLMMRDLRR
jgi:amino-acid N-acetyltransferase